MDLAIVLTLFIILIMLAVWLSEGCIEPTEITELKKMNKLRKSRKVKKKRPRS